MDSCYTGLFSVRHHPPIKVILAVDFLGGNVALRGVLYTFTKVVVNHILFFHIFSPAKLGR